MAKKMTKLEAIRVLVEEARQDKITDQRTARCGRAAAVLGLNQEDAQAVAELVELNAPVNLKTFLEGFWKWEGDR